MNTRSGSAALRLPVRSQIRASRLNILFICIYALVLIAAISAGCVLTSQSAATPFEVLTMVPERIRPQFPAQEHQRETGSPGTRGARGKGCRCHAPRLLESAPFRQAPGCSARVQSIAQRA